MTQADSVLSTPPTNTSALPTDTTRRHLLVIAAGGAVAAAIPAVALAGAPAVDPVFELIEAHRRAHAAHMSSLDLQNRFERRYGPGKGSWISTQPCHDADDAFVAFVASPTGHRKCHNKT